MGSGKIYSYSNGGSWSERVIGSLIFMVVIFLFFYLSFQIYKFLFLLSPVFLIIALAIQPKVVWDYIKNIGLIFNQSILGGLFHLFIQIIGFPIVAIGLIFKAWALKKFGTINDRMQSEDSEEYTSYEEIKEEKIEFPKTAKKQKEESMANRYDELFE